MSEIAKKAPRVQLETLKERGWWETIEAVARDGGVSVEEVLSYNRTPSVVRVRHRLMALLSYVYDAGMAELGRLFGRDHSSIIHALGRTDERGKDLAKRLGLRKAYALSGRARCGNCGDAGHNRRACPQVQLDLPLGGDDGQST